MARQPRGLAGAAGAARGVRVRRRSRPAPPTAPASSPARSGSTPASWSRSCAPSATASAPRSGRWPPPGAGTWSRAPRAPALRVGGPLARRTKRGPGAAEGRPPRSCRSPSTKGPPPSTSPPASTGSSAGSPVEALVEVSQARRPAASGSPRTSPATAAAALELEGLPRRRTATRRTRWSSGSGAGAGRGRCRSSIDATSCTQGDRRPRRGRPRRGERRAPRRARVLDSVAWAHDRLLPWLEVSRRVGSVTVHPTCATRHLGLARRLRSLAGELAEEVYVAPSATCCGFAGDRGISHPELTAVGHRAPRPPSSPAATSTPTSPATAPARSASSRATGAATSRSSSCSSC